MMLKRLFMGLFLLSSLVGCDDDPDETDAGTDAGSIIDAGGDMDAGGDDPDAGAAPDAGGDADAGTTDAGMTDAGMTDAGERGDAGMVECVFNADCPADQRCECDEVDGCFCQFGVRGTGQNGVDTCTDGNDCESSVCVEGPASGTDFYCSGPCESDADCTGALPLCLSFLGICARDPEA